MRLVGIVLLAQTEIPASVWGPKAAGLLTLSNAGARIPESICLRPILPHEETPPVEHLDAKELIARFMATMPTVEEWIVRSSGTLEDTEASSNAGLFTSRRVKAFGSRGVHDILQVAMDLVTNHSSPNHPFAVILQPWITGVISGVFFSCDPTTGRRGQMLTTFVMGSCDQLVSGAVQPAVVVGGQLNDSPSVPGLLKVHALELKRLAVRLEDMLDAPVDCEFTLGDSGLFLLQARPVAALTKWRRAKEVLEVEPSTDLPGAVLSYPKVALRLMCQQRHVMISRAWIVTASSWSAPKAYDFPSGRFSCVLIHPRLVDGKIWRIFTDNPVRSASEVLDNASEYWVRHAIVSHLLPSQITGVVTTSSEGEIFIQLARGHFVPKGIVAPTVYAIRLNTVAILSRPQQTHYYDIDPTTGDAIKVAWCGFPEAKGDTLLALADIARQLALSPSDYLEFGIGLDDQPFVIDIQRHQGATYVQSPSTTLISPGLAEGEVIILDEQKETEGHFFEVEHLADRLTSGLRPAIVAATFPTLAHISRMLELADRNYRVAGMIFEVYSPLCHLALLLREWQIPAVVLPGFHDSNLAKAKTLIISASAEGDEVEVREK